MNPQQHDVNALFAQFGELFMQNLEPLIADLKTVMFWGVEIFIIIAGYFLVIKVMEIVGGEGGMSWVKKTSRVNSAILDAGRQVAFGDNEEDRYRKYANRRRMSERYADEKAVAKAPTFDIGGNIQTGVKGSARMKDYSGVMG